MKRFLFLCLTILLVLPITAFSQGRSSSVSSEERAEQKTKQMQTQLNLNKEQYTKVKQINLEIVEEMMALRSNNSDRDAMRTEAERIREKQDKAYQGVLTDDQWTKYQNMNSSQNGQSRAPANSRSRSKKGRS